MTQQDTANETALAVQAPGATSLELAPGAPPRRRRLSLGMLLFIVVAVIPALSGTLYFGLIASDRYVSHARMTVRSVNGASNMLGSVLGAMVNGGAVNDSFIVQDFIHSREIVGRMQQWVDLKAIYATPQADLLSRLEADATDEDLIEYYRDRVRATFDPTTGIVDLRVEAFSPADAQAVAAAILAMSDELVNGVSDKARSDSLRFSEEQLKRAETRLENARVAIRLFRNRHGELDPSASASSIGAIVAAIESELAKAKTELDSSRAYLRDDSSKLVMLKARIAALQQQLSKERSRLGNASSATTYSDLLTEFERLRVEEELAQALYTSAAAGLEAARAEAARKHIYLVPFVRPSLPDEATEPDRPLMIAASILGSLVAFGIVTLLAAAIREHARL